MIFKQLLIIGSGGLGREILATLKNTKYLSKYDNVGFIDDGKGSVKGVNIVGGNEYLRNLEFSTDIIIAIGNTAVRRKIIDEIKDLKNINFPTYIHQNASLYDKYSIQIG